MPRRQILSSEEKERLLIVPDDDVFLRTDPYKCILCGDQLRFISAQAGRHVTELVTERLHSIDRKRWLLAQVKG